MFLDFCCDGKEEDLNQIHPPNHKDGKLRRRYFSATRQLPRFRSTNSLSSWWVIMIAYLFLMVQCVVYMSDDVVYVEINFFMVLRVSLDCNQFVSTAACKFYLNQVGLPCTKLDYRAPSWFTLHQVGLPCTKLDYLAPSLISFYQIVLLYTKLVFLPPGWFTLHLIELPFNLCFIDISNHTLFTLTF